MLQEWQLNVIMMFVIEASIISDFFSILIERICCLERKKQKNKKQRRVAYAN